MKTSDRDHRWEDVPDGNGIQQCKFCKNFRRRRANVVTGALMHGMVKKTKAHKGDWITEYAIRGKSKWTYEHPKCV